MGGRGAGRAQLTGWGPWFLHTESQFCLAPAPATSHGPQNRVGVGGVQGLCRHLLGPHTSSQGSGWGERATLALSIFP